MADIYDPASPEFQAIAERARQRSEALRERERQILAPVEAKPDYYKALRQKYSDLPSLRETDYVFLENV
ncbi:MAG: hypothetical protein LBF78_07540, partial [Treponema sp.]|nr:hypothetical protein [Treponema sp.]